MTEPERRVARQLIDQAKRDWLGRSGFCVCEWCGAEFEPNAHNQTYCRPACRKKAWLATPRGRAFQRATDRRYAVRRRERLAAA